MLLLLLCIVYRSGLLLQLFELDSQALLVTCTLTIQPRISPFCGCELTSKRFRQRICCECWQRDKRVMQCAFLGQEDCC